MVWCLTDMVFEEDIKGSSLSFIFPSWNWFNAYTHAHVHTPLSTHLFTYRQKIRWEKKTSAPSSEEPSQINFFPVRPLMHLHLSPLTYSLPPPAFVCSFLSPPVLALRTEKLFLLFSVCVCEWTRPITSLFNEHVVFSCSAHSPNTHSQHWQLSGKRCVCVCVVVCVSVGAYVCV